MTIYTILLTRGNTQISTEPNTKIIASVLVQLQSRLVNNEKLEGVKPGNEINSLFYHYHSTEQSVSFSPPAGVELGAELQ